MRSKKIIVSVISDLVTDQRVMKECNTLYKLGYEILLIGRYSKNTFDLDKRLYKIIRFKNLFKKGPGMYLIFNIQLFFYIICKKADLLWANDLDTLIPNYLISKIKNVKLIYDSHEYFTMSVAKINSRKIWNFLEEFCFPNLKNVITVNESIKKVYEKKYHVPITVIRNVPYLSSNIHTENSIQNHKKILIIQGVGINENRGAEEAVEMMTYLPDRFILYFIGSGTIIRNLKQKVIDLDLENKVMFLDTMPYDAMMEYTRKAFLGLIFEKIHTTDEHKFSLPNRFFDYIKAGIPVLSTEAVEIVSLIEKYNIGTVTHDLSPVSLANKILKIEENEKEYQNWCYSTYKAAMHLCWENEEKKLVNFLNQLV